MEQCEQCKGTGIIWWWLDGIRYRYVCPDCEGSGIYGFKSDSYAADRESQVQEPAF